LNGRDHFWNGAQLAVFVDIIRCQNGLVIQFFLSDADPAQLVTNYSDIFFSVLHNGRVMFLVRHDKEMFLKNTGIFYY